MEFVSTSNLVAAETPAVQLLPWVGLNSAIFVRSTSFMKVHVMGLEPALQVHPRAIQRSRGEGDIPSPMMSPEQTILGIGIHDHLHGRQACHNL